MNTMELVHFVSTGERPRQQPVCLSTPPFFSELIRPARQAILCARQHLLGEQRSDGSWVEMQTCDAGAASQLVLLLRYLDEEPNKLAGQATTTILDEQLPTGGWSLVPNGPVDLSTSVQAYVALKLLGLDPSDSRLARAREVIRQAGGADGADGTTRFFLALLGQVDYDRCAPIPPELLVLNRDRVTYLAPLAAIWAHRPVHDVGVERGVRELFVKAPRNWDKPRSAGGLRETRYSVFAPLLRWCERLGWTFLRKRALERAESQLLRNINPESIGQLDFSELVWHTIAIHALGYQSDSPEFRACEERLNALVRIDEESDTARPQLRASPLPVTIAMLESLAASGMGATHPSAAAAVEWLSQFRRSAGLPLGVADLAGLLQLLSTRADGCVDDGLPPEIDVRRNRSRRTNRRNGGALTRAARIGRVAAPLVARLLAQQNADGGWSARVDRNGDSAPDVTGNVLEALRHHGGERVAAAAGRAVDYLRRAQRPDGSWESATGVRLIHGTSLAVRGLLAADAASDDVAVAAGINWLLVHQDSSGGWGELPCLPTGRARDDFVEDGPTASQTAWALLALIAAGRANAPAVRRGIDFLLQTQQDDGPWREPQFVLRDPIARRWFHSDLQATAGPLLALSRWAVAASATQTDAAEQIPLRLVGVP